MTWPIISRSVMSDQINSLSTLMKLKFTNKKIFSDES